MRKAGYTVISELGRGGQGAMYLCSKRLSFRRYCIKFYSKADAKPAVIAELIDEYAMMKELNSPYVAKTYEIFQDRSFYYLVNEPYSGGDLTKLGKRAFDDGVSMSEGWWRNIFRQCVEGVNYLHTKAIIHCDIKEPNIMIADGRSYQKCRPVLIDFGLSTLFGSEIHHICGTPGYIPPETWRTERWYPKGDVFSLGITFFQLIIGRVPQIGVLGILQEHDLKACIRATESRPLPWESLPRDMPLLQELLREMTDRDMSERPRCPGVLGHEWLASRSNAPLPQDSLLGLIGKAAEREAQDNLVRHLAEANNLDELRALRFEFLAADPMARGTVTLDHAWRLFRKYHTPSKAMEVYAKAALGDDYTASHQLPYEQLMKKAIDLKGDYGHQYIQELFDALDKDGTGTLSMNELMALLNADYFECPFEDIRELMARMDRNGDGVITYEEFKRVVIEDGRIARRADVESRASIWEKHFVG